jgi:dinuclear metal center YbgI/SA1388 family protein
MPFLMATVDDIISRLEQIAPLAAAEDWDNVGLLVGDRRRTVTKLMTCLTLTPDTAAEAIGNGAELVVVHHPLPFRPVSQITTDTTAGRLLFELIEAGVSVFSAHTAFDSAEFGINQQLAAGFGLEEILPLVASAKDPRLGSGRMGTFRAPIAFAEFIDRVKNFLSLGRLRVVGNNEKPLRRVGVACGSGGSFLERARLNDCDCLVTGEASFHTCLEAETLDVGLVLCGHFASERFAVEHLGTQLASFFPEVNVWPSQSECDPIREA